MSYTSTPPSPLGPIALPPLDMPFADVVLRSSDGTEYRMSKTVLSCSSPVFASLFSLPQPDHKSSADEHWDALPVVPLSEPAQTLDVLLQFCLPRTPPLERLNNVPFTVQILEGAKKYEVDWALSAACTALKRLAEHEPIHVYVVACQYGLEDVARDAARFCLRLSLREIFDSEVSDLKGLSAEEFRRLLKYRQTCATAVTEHISSWGWIDDYTAALGGGPNSRVWKATCCGNREGGKKNASQQRQHSSAVRWISHVSSSG